LEVEEAIKVLGSIPPTQILSHGDEMCEVARKYLIGLDSLLAIGNNPIEPPVWITIKYKWGPTRYPVYWCQIVKAEELDCGSLSAVIREIYRSRGVHTLPVQLILKYPVHIIEHYIAMWRRKGLPVNWIWGNYVYHEVVGVILDECEMKIYDPVENSWIKSSGHVERGRVAAIRISGEETCSYLHWENKYIELNKWHILE
jgi:hypothetical protein